MTRLPARERTEGQPDEDAKVIVRSNGTVTYVGKDIAYHLWKFGLLGKDFGYRKFYTLSQRPRSCWISMRSSRRQNPTTRTSAARSAHLQRHRLAPVRSAGQRHRGPPRPGLHRAGRSLHPLLLRDGRAHARAAPSSSAIELSDEDRAQTLHRSQRPQGLRRQSRRPHRQAHRRRQDEVDTRQPELSEDQNAAASPTQIAIGALRYFMLKFTRNSVIAFDFKEALSFEGETGPYVQYAVVRAAQHLPQGRHHPRNRLGLRSRFRQVLRGERLKSGRSGSWQGRPRR